MVSRMPEKNKAINKLEGFPHVLWINLDRVTERKKYMEEQLSYWGIENHHRISGVDGDEYEEFLKGTLPHNMNKGEIACVMSHLNALKYFVEETDLDEIIIMEDDVDLSPVTSWTFTWKEVRKRVPINFDCLQLTIINPNGITLKLHIDLSMTFLLLATLLLVIMQLSASVYTKGRRNGNSIKTSDRGQSPKI